MHRTLLLLVSALALVSIPDATAAESARKVEITHLGEMMTKEEFRAAGLGKLTPAELAALESWMRSVTGTVEKQARAQVQEQVVAEETKRGERNFGKTNADESESIESRILGRFTGWEGGTVFRLENGQVWKQRDTSSAYYPLQDPKLTIRRAGFGFRMYVEGIPQSVGVTRVK